MIARVNAALWLGLLLSTVVWCEDTFLGCNLNPCQNGGLCESKEGTYTCHCSKEHHQGHLYGGDNCTVALLGCQRHRCQNGGTCNPYLSDGRHRYSCSCLEGFTGTRCQTLTTFSFERSGFLHAWTALTNPHVPLNVSLSFRTNQGSGTLLHCTVGDQLLVLELLHGRLRFTTQNVHEVEMVFLELPQVLSDGQWHRMEASLQHSMLELRLLDHSCTEKTCHAKAMVDSESTQWNALPELGSGLAELNSFQSIFIGGPGYQGATSELHFEGCMRDVRLDSWIAAPGSRALVAEVNVSQGCSDRDRCEASPCLHRGRCISQGWRSYTCECHRPYKGEDCLEEYITAGFGKKDSESYAIFVVEDDDPGDSVAVSMFVRTRRHRGLLLVLANSTSQYLHLWLDEGKVKVQINNFESLLGREAVDDGHLHLVTVRMELDKLTLFQSATAQSSTALHGVLTQPGDRVYVGGLPDRRASQAFGGYFKGCIQDLRVGSRRLQFYPTNSSVSSYALQSLVGVTRGCVSDDSCSTKPCLNGGVCYSVWGDFTCSCPPNTAGRRCEEVKWCELSPCPPTAACKAYRDGFDCVSNVTLRDDSPTVTFKGNGNIRRHLLGVSLTVRTRRHHASLLHAEKASEFLTISVHDGYLVLELQTGKRSHTLSAQSQHLVNDGKWHSVVLTMENVAINTSQWTMLLDERREEVSFSSATSDDLDFLREEVDILLGGFGSEAEANLAVCMGSVEIGSLPLSLYDNTELNLPRPQEEQFVRTSGTPLYGCQGSDVCGPNPCQHAGVCEDHFDAFYCQCSPGWGGRSCEAKVDVCSAKPCVHGNCSVVPGGYECLCELGYAGDDCEITADVCVDHECGHGATCLRGISRYACLCPRNATGPLCKEKTREVPWYIDRPPLPVSLCGNERWNYSCFNGGNCSSSEELHMCECVPGFTGQWCEVEIDECASNPCLNGGFCRNLLNRFHCVCELSFAGEHCQMDVSDFYIYIFLLLWQNIFQLLSYLILQLDDDPEVEWMGGFED